MSNERGEIDRHLKRTSEYIFSFRNQEFESKVREAAIDLHLQAEEASPTAQNNFVLKVIQLKEIFDVRHSVFIIGNAGTGEFLLHGSRLQSSAMLLISSQAKHKSGKLFSRLIKTPNVDRMPWIVGREDEQSDYE